MSNEPTDIWPRDTCLDWHAAPEAPAYRWEFTEDGRDFSANVPMRVLCNDPARLRRLALAGAGLAMLFEDAVRDDITSDDLVTVLDAFSVPFPGFFLSYPPQHASPALRALVAHLRYAPHGDDPRRQRPPRAGRVPAPAP